MRKEVQTREPRRLIVFTDLDGTLLNHGDYSWEAARPALEKTRALGIPLVICTSKTRPEVELLRAEIGVAGPFIVENGGGIFFPREYDDLPVGSSLVMDTYRCIPLGIPYARIRAFIEETAKTSSITGFGDMTVEEVSRLTGLDARRASLARQREFSEPFVLAREEELHEIERLAHLKGLAITRGGRFYHCMGYGNDKGGSVKRVRDIFARHWRGGHRHRLRGQPQRLPPPGGRGHTRAHTPRRRLVRGTRPAGARPRPVPGQQGMERCRPVGHRGCRWRHPRRPILTTRKEEPP